MPHSQHHHGHVVARDETTPPPSDAKSARAVLDEGLTAIYGEDRADLHVVERGASALSRWLPRVVLGLAITTAVAFLAFFLYQTFFLNRSSTEPLVMAFDVPPTLVSGERATIVLAYRNPTGVPLASLEIDLNVPAMFRVVSATPAPTDAEKLMWDLGTVSARSDGSITLEGVWVAAAGSSSTLQALASYKPANFNADFHDITSTTVATDASTAMLAVVADRATGTPGETITYVATVANGGAEPFALTELALTLPEGFFVTASSPALPAGEAPTWTIGDMAAGFSGSYSVSGTFASDVSGPQTLAATLAVGEGAQQARQAEATADVEVLGSSLQLDMIVGGATDDVTVDPESTLRVSLRVQNIGDEALTDVSALLDFQSEGVLPIAWSAVSLDGGRVTADGIRFDASVIGTLDAGERMLFNLAFPLTPAASAASSAFTLAWNATHDAVTVSTSPLTVRINSDAELTAQGRYFDDDGAPLGSGPLPPALSERTSYRLFWTIVGGVHNLEDVTVSATLPEGVVWDTFSQADLGVIAYDAGNRIVTWTIAALPDDIAQVGANMSLSITPTSDDVGTFVNLLGPSLMVAKDVETGSPVESGAGTVTTELPDDGLAQGKGVVVE